MSLDGSGRRQPAGCNFGCLRGITLLREPACPGLEEAVQSGATVPEWGRDPQARGTEASRAAGAGMGRLDGRVTRRGRDPRGGGWRLRPHCASPAFFSFCLQTPWEGRSLGIPASQVRAWRSCACACSRGPAAPRAPRGHGPSSASFEAGDSGALSSRPRRQNICSFVSVPAESHRNEAARGSGAQAGEQRAGGGSSCTGVWHHRVVIANRTSVSLPTPRFKCRSPRPQCEGVRSSAFGK